MSERHPRMPCCVPFCGRGSTTFPPGWEFLCANHWRLVDRELKLLRTKARRRRGSGERYWRLEGLIWRRMKRQAIERAAGAAA